MNKSLLFIFLIMNAGFCFGQSDYFITRNFDKNKRHTNFESVSKFDSINTITHTKDYGNENISLAGEWLDFNHMDFNHESIISHCPVLVEHNTNSILEIGIFDKESYEGIFRYYNYEDGNKKFLKRSEKINSEIVKFTVNKKQKYIVNTIKRYSLYNKDNTFTCLVLFGEKKGKIYMISVYNFDLQKIEYYENFVVKTFNNN